MPWRKLLGALVLAAGVGTIVDWQYQAMLVRRAVRAVHDHYAVGMTVDTVLADVKKQFPEFTQYSANDCAKWAPVTTPTYQPRGGPCIFGIIRTGSTWWGFESAVTYRFIFGPEGDLRDATTDPIYTFL